MTTQAKATATATATTDNLPASTLTPAIYAANDSTPIAAAGDLNAVKAPTVHANDPDKGFIHADKKPAKNQRLQTAAENAASSTAKKYPAAPMTFKHLQNESAEMLDGCIELDESYFGGVRKGKRGR